MNIVLVGGQNVPGIGGVESYMYNLAKALYGLGHRVTILCSDRHAYTTEVDGSCSVHKVCPRSNLIALPLLFLKSVGYIFKHRKEIDVVNYQSILFAFVSGWLAILCGCKVCYTIHSLPEDNPKHGNVLKLMMKMIGYVSIWLCGSNVLTISNSKAEEIKSRYCKMCKVIPCGVQMPTTTIDSDILERFGIISERYYLTIGRIDPVKNLDTLINAFKIRNNPDYQLVIAGDNNNAYGDRLRELASEHNNVLFVGSVMGHDKECLLKHCFVNCLVSSSEGMPISLLEAMAYGKPCIVTDIPAIHEIMRPEWAWWCKVGDADSLAQQMMVVESTHNLTKYAREMAVHIDNSHSWSYIAKQYVGYLNHI